MRIGIDCHNLEGQRTGVGRYILNLMKEWLANPTASGAEFNLYFKNAIPDDIRKISYAHDRERKIKMRSLNSKRNALFKHFYLPHAARQDNIDVLFCPDYVLPLYVGGPASHIKTAVTIHDIIYEARPNEYSWPSRADRVLLKWASKQSAKCADIIFVPSEFTRNEILKYYKIDSKKIVVTPLAPDRIFREIPPPAKEEAGGVSKYILFVGSIFNRRFLPECIQGFVKFAGENKDFSPYGGPPEGWKFLVVGNNHTKPYRDIVKYISAANKELGRDAIIWKKYIESDEELAELYNAAFATIWLSSYEGFGLPVLESMACGTPVITSRAGSLPEIAGDAALYINNPKDPHEIASALYHLARDRGYYDELVNTGLLQAQKFSWQKTARETLDKILSL